MTLPKLSKVNTFQYIVATWKHSVYIRYVLFFFLVILFYMSLSSKLVPEQYDIKVGIQSEVKIVSPNQILNTKATVEAQEKQAELVPPQYTIVQMHNENLMTELLDRIYRLNEDDAVSSSSKIKIYSNEFPRRLEKFVANFTSNSEKAGTYSSVLLQKVKNVVNEQKYSVPDEIYIKIVRLTSEDIQQIKPVAINMISTLMSDPIYDANTARVRVAEMVNSSILTKRIQREVVQELSRMIITPNKFRDEEKTWDAKLEAKKNTPSIYINPGDVLVKKGQAITEELYELMGDNNLLRKEVNYFPQIGLLLLSLLLSAAVFLFIFQNHEVHFTYNNIQLLMVLIIFFITTVLIHLGAILQKYGMNVLGFLTPISVGTMLLTLFLHTSLAFICATLFSIVASIVLNTQQGQLFDFHFGLFTIITSFVAILFTYRASQRFTIFKGSTMVCLFGSLCIIIFTLIDSGQWDKISTLYGVGFACGGGVMTAILVIGLIPFFEGILGVLSPLKLVELSNASHPLLQKLLIEAPGTYHHSVMVANLSEVAAEAIGANGLLCRVGSYYHDIGKTKRPRYFIENQNNRENPHDSIDPALSKSIIIAHTYDGVHLQKQYKLPKLIRDIAEQHHGTTVLHSFYQKAIKEAEAAGKEIDFTENDFRYPGPKAQSKEAALVGIADSVEAAIRSLRQPTVEHIESMIKKIIKSRVDDHQFNECDLTMKELDIVAKRLQDTVLGIFHSRIEYADFNIDKGVYRHEHSTYLE